MKRRRDIKDKNRRQKRKDKNTPNIRNKLRSQAVSDETNENRKDIFERLDEFMEKNDRDGHGKVNLTQELPRVNLTFAACLIVYCS